VDEVHPDAVGGLLAQLERRDAALRQGHGHVGWKLGMGERERIRGTIAVGHLTSATQIAPGGDYLFVGANSVLHADAELALELGRDVDPSSDTATVAAAVRGYGAALELVDLTPLPDEPWSVVAENVFHRGVAFGRIDYRLESRLVGRLLVNGEARAAAPVAADLFERVASAARLLAAAGQRMQAGDLIITGSIVQVPIGAGDEVVADLGRLGAVSVTISEGA
jgi:2-keto-4-pentenoate hydratase